MNRKFLGIVFLIFTTFHILNALELGVEVGTTELNFGNDKRYIYNTSNIYFNHFFKLYKRNKVGFSGNFVYGSNPTNSYVDSYKSFEGNVVFVINLKSYIGTPDYFYLSSYVNPNRLETGRIDLYLSGGVSLNQIDTDAGDVNNIGYQSTVGINWFYIQNLGIGMFYTFKWINEHPVKNIQYFSFNMIGEF